PQETMPRSRIAGIKVRHKVGGRVGEVMASPSYPITCLWISISIAECAWATRTSAIENRKALVVVGIRLSTRHRDQGDDDGWRGALRQKVNRAICERNVDPARVEGIQSEVVRAVDHARPAGAGAVEVRTPERIGAVGGVAPAAEAAEDEVADRGV